MRLSAGKYMNILLLVHHSLYDTVESLYKGHLWGMKGGLVSGVDLF